MRKADPALHEERRAQILAAALRCFRRQGFMATTTAAICAEAGMSPGHLFHYFKTKDDIVAAIAEHDRAQAAAAIRRIAAADDLVSALAAAAAPEADHGEYGLDGQLGLELHAEAARNPKVAEALRQNYRGIQADLQAAIARAQGLGTVDPGLDPVGAAILIMALFEGVERGAAADPGLDQRAAGQTLGVLLERFLRPPGTGGGAAPGQPGAIRVSRNRAG